MKQKFRNDVAIWLAIPKDAEVLLEIKNDEDVRRFSIVSKEPILWENHVKWFNQKLCDPNTRLFCIHYKNQIVGDVRLDISDVDIEVSIRMKKKFRRMGIASWALFEAVWYARTVYSKKKLFAKILWDNEPSKALFRKMGFEMVRCENDIFFFEFKG